MFKDRLKLYKELEKNRNSKLLVYVTGDRRGMETQMASDVLERFVEHLDLFKDSNKMPLVNLNLKRASQLGIPGGANLYILLISYLQCHESLFP